MDQQSSRGLAGGADELPRPQTSQLRRVFHAQQCVEKSLKARLEEAAIPFGRTHDLLVLHQLLLPLEPGWAVLQPLLIFLNPFAIAYRYPGMTATKANAREALRNWREVRRVLRLDFGLPV